MNISVIIPVYNDTQALTELLEHLFIACEHNLPEVLLVDDGSAPPTWHQLIAIKRHFSHRDIRLLRLDRNRGQHLATLCGLLQARGEICVTLDADLQHPPEAIPQLLKTLKDEHCDLVYASAYAGQPRGRRLTSCLFKCLVHQPGNPVDRRASGFRAISAVLIKHAFIDTPALFWAIDSALMAASHHSRYVRVTHAPRTHGQSGYTPLMRYALALRILYYSPAFFRLARLVVIATALACALARLPTSPATLASVLPAVWLPALAGVLLLSFVQYGQQLARRRHQNLQRFIAEVV